MKILLASSSSGSRGGGELYLLYLARALAERGHQMSLWTATHPRMEELAESFSEVGTVLRSPYHNTYDYLGRSITSYFDRGTAHRIAQDWRGGHFDFIHLNKQNLEDGLELLAALRQTQRPNLCTIHLTQSATYLKARWAWPRDFFSRRALRAYPGLMVTVLENRRTDLAAFIGECPRLRTIPNGVPLFDLTRRPEHRAARRQECRVAEDELLFVAVGRLVPQKRPLVFLAYAEQILRVIPHARFLWVGDGRLSVEWDAWVAARNLGSRIQRLDWQRDVPSFLMSADVFLHTADFEGLPLAILEAMSAGLPCAITENLLGEMPFLHRDNSIAIDAGNAWLGTLQDRDQLARLGAAARQLAEAEFCYQTMAERYEALYREAAAKWT